MIKSGSFIRLVMPEIEPKVMKAEDGAQDRGPCLKEDLITHGSRLVVWESPNATKPAVLRVRSGDSWFPQTHPGVHKVKTGFICLFRSHSLIDI